MAPTAALSGGTDIGVAGRRIEQLALLLFWLLPIEGILRKWVAPSFANYLFFVRDPVLLVLYLYAIRAGVLKTAGPLLWTGAAFSVIAIVLAFVQSFAIRDPRFLTVAIYGWRQYFLYLPLPFILAAMLNQYALVRFAKHILVAAVFFSPLIVLQASSAPTSVINRGISDDVNLQFQSFSLTGDKIRPSGPFTSAQGMNEFVPCATAMLFAIWLMPPRKDRPALPWLAVAAAAVGSSIAVCGSRGAFLRIGIIVVSALVLGLVSRAPKIRRRALTIPIVLLACGAFLYPIVFPDALKAITQRVAEAHATESRSTSFGIFGRAFAEYIDFVRFIPETPILGDGLGLGGNGRTYLKGSDAVPFYATQSETDWARHIVDMGVLVGIAFIFYRVLFFFHLLLETLRATRLSSSPFPMLLFGYAGVGLLNGQLTGHGTVGGFLWLFIGLAMASCRIALEHP
jgi:hypothetical protein